MNSERQNSINKINSFMNCLSDVSIKKLHHLLYHLYKEEVTEPVSHVHNRQSAIDEINEFMQHLSDKTIKNIHMLSILLYGQELETKSIPF